MNKGVHVDPGEVYTVRLPKDGGTLEYGRAALRAFFNEVSSASPRPCEALASRDPERPT